MLVTQLLMKSKLIKKYPQVSIYDIYTIYNFVKSQSEVFIEKRLLNGFYGIRKPLYLVSRGCKRVR